MRNAMLALVVVVLGPWAAQAQAQQAWLNKMFKGVTSHDFGSVPRGAQLYYQFQLTNIWAVPLEITNVRTSCGCVTATPSLTKVDSRQSATIDVTMDARRFTGSKTISIYVTVGPEYVSTATLTVSANSRADVVFNPGQISFGVVPRGQSPTQVIDVEYAGALDWRATEVVSNGAPIDATLEELYRRPGQVGYRIKATLKADAPAGTIKHDLLLKTNDPASPLVPVLAEAIVQASLTVVPSTLSMGTPKVGETVTKSVVVRGSKPFKILAIEGLGDGIAAALPPTVAPVQIVTVKYQPGQAGGLKRELKIQTDLEGGMPAIVTIEGNVSP